MSAHCVVWLYCDLGGENCEPSGDGSLGESQTVADARDVARRHGWHHTRDGRDICPNCWEAGAR